MKKSIVSTIVVLILAMVIAGCSSSETSKNTSEKTKKEHVTWMNILYQTTPPTNVVQDKVKEITGTELEFTWVPDASKDERINTALASDSLADIVTLSSNSLQNSSVRSALTSGMFWEVSEYLDDYPNLKKIPDYARESGAIEGKLYGVPRKSDVARFGVIIRKDWLDKLGLEMPTNVDELMKIAEAFTTQDPDGNGKDDTTGFIDRGDLKYGVFKTLAVYYGAPNSYEVDEETGEFTADFQTDEYIQAMDYMRKAFENGYINKDFVTTSPEDQREKFVTGKGGITFSTVFNTKSLYEAAKGVQDDMVLETTIHITGPSGEKRAWSDANGIAGLFSIPKTNVPTEEDLRDVLAFLDAWAGEEISNLIGLGIEGEHYNVVGEEGDKKVIEPINPDKKQADTAAYNGSGMGWAPRNLVAKDTPEYVKISDAQLIQLEEYAVFNPIMGLNSETANTRGSEMEKMILDATYKYILGEIELDTFKAEVKKWEDNGGKDILSEYKDSYLKANDKK
ncbi:extracellular solute-binding protein [Fredinandcohnia onubensis]|uniref:extracellular solute-binding protein n=1 Tax=Fredinandcohnia onubensis TaxID=1571209 RepID=UPI000C0BD713|nr:extracellular solute-binding protein [Fredinandcohnia onubensis]